MAASVTIKSLTFYFARCIVSLIMYDQNTPTQAQPQPSIPVMSPQNTPPTKSKAKLLLTLLCLLLLAGLAGAAAKAYKAQQDAHNAKSEAASLRVKVAALESNEHAIPTDAIEVSSCVPNMGHHYLPKGADPEYGPFLLVNTDRKVIGVEYMFTHDMFSPIPNLVPDVAVVMKDSPLYNWKFDHIEQSFTKGGHPGLEEEHHDIHLYTVTQEERKQACI
jgi:hypothetical protein